MHYIEPLRFRTGAFCLDTSTVNWKALKRDNVFDVELIDCRGFDSVAQITDEICCKVNQQNRLRSNASSLEDITPDNWVHGGRKVLFVVEGGDPCRV